MSTSDIEFVKAAEGSKIRKFYKNWRKHDSEMEFFHFCQESNRSKRFSVNEAGTSFVNEQCRFCNKFLTKEVVDVLMFLSMEK